MKSKIIHLKKIAAPAFLALALAAPAFAATYYISPTGSDSGGDGTISNPYRTLSKASSVGRGGDTFIYRDGTYDYSGSELNGVNMLSGGSTGYTVIKAENDGGAVFTITTGLSMRENADPLQQYIQIEGFKFTGAYSKVIYGDHIKVLRCAFEGGPGAGNAVNTQVGGNDNSLHIAHDVLLEDCWFWGSGGRYNLLVFNTEKVVLRRITIRHDGGWTYDGSNPEAGLAWYNSSTGTISDILLVDNNGNYSAGWSQAFYFIHNPSANPDHVSDYNSLHGIMVVKSKNLNMRADAITSTGNQMTDSLFLDGENGCLSFGPNNNTTFTVNRSGCINKSVTQSGDFKGGFGYFGSGGSVSLTNLIIAGMTGSDLNGITSKSYFDTFNNGSTTSGTGRQTFNPLTNGWLYPVRIEAGSNLANDGNGDQMGPNIVNRWGTSGALYGDAGYDADSGQSLWPWPNQLRIIADMCDSVSTGFCADTTLSHYVMNYFGNGNPFPDDTVTKATPRTPDALKPEQKYVSANKPTTFGSDAVDVSIRAVSGREIFHAQKTGGSAIVWDGRDSSGTLVESGLYLCKIKGSSGKMVYAPVVMVK